MIKEPTKTTLVATTYNEAKGITNWLTSLKEQTLQPDQIVIVDGGSTDGTIQAIENFSSKHNLPIDLIIDPKCNRSSCPGPIARGRNIAIRSANNIHIICTDAGCVMDPNYVNKMTEAFSEGHDYICGAYDLYNPNSYQMKLRSSFVPNFETVDFPNNFLPSSRSIGFKKELWERVGGYPEQTFTGEDTLFALKLTKIACNPCIKQEAKVFWIGPANRSELLKKCFAYGYGDGQLRQNLSQYILRSALFLLPPLWLAHNLIKGRSFEAWFIHYAQLAGFYAGIARSFKASSR